MKVLYCTLIFSASIFSFPSLKAQTMPYPALVGYWENWNTLFFANVNSAYNVIIVAFPGNSDGKYTMTLDQWSIGPYANIAAFKSAIATAQGQGKKVLISLGGATIPIKLDSTYHKTNFINSVGKLLTDYGFDGIDLDLETSSMNFSNIKMTGNSDVALNNMISAVQQILANYQTAKGKRCLLTMAPEVAYVQGGYGLTGTYSGAMLPIVEALKTNIDFLQVQLYNTGQNIKALNGSSYTDNGSADFIIAMTEMVLQGFTTGKLSGGQGVFSGLPESKVIVGLPACASGGNFSTGVVTTTVAKQAINYLRGVGSKPGTYTLIKSGGYPNLAGMMTWDVNIDKGTCSDAFATSYSTIFAGLGTAVENNMVSNEMTLYPNPAQQQITLDMGSNSVGANISVYNSLGQVMIQKQVNNEQKVVLDIAGFPAGIYFIQTGQSVQKFMKVN